MKCVLNIFNDEQLEFTNWSYGKAYSGQEAAISKKWSLQKLGFHMEILDPGAVSCPYHSHQEEEEVFLVVKGSATVRQENEFYQIKEGDLVAFPIGVAHQFYNHTDAPFMYLALSNSATNDFCHYPDSNKTLDRQQRKIFQNGEEVDDYWKGEENPLQFWPPEIRK